MKALTLNVHAWMEENSLGKLKDLAQVIAKKDYDFISLQEVNQPMEESKISHETFIKPNLEINDKPLKKGNYAKVLVDELKELGVDYYWTWSVNHIGYDIYDEGLAFLSKTPFEVDSLLISETKAFENITTRNILKITTSIDGHQATFINGHFSWWTSPSDKELFKGEWDKVREYIEEDETDYFFAMGDFNNEASIRGQGYDYLLNTANYLTDTFKTAKIVSGEYTVPGEIAGWKDHHEGKRIDYIFTGPKINIKSYSVVFDGRETPIVSDHFGVEIVFEIL